MTGRQKSPSDSASRVLAPPAKSNRTGGNTSGHRGCAACRRTPVSITSTHTDRLRATRTGWRGRIRPGRQPSWRHDGCLGVLMFADLRSRLVAQLAAVDAAEVAFTRLREAFGEMADCSASAPRQREVAIAGSAVPAGRSSPATPSERARARQGDGLAPVAGRRSCVGVVRGRGRNAARIAPRRRDASRPPPGRRARPRETMKPGPTKLVRSRSCTSGR